MWDSLGHGWGWFGVGSIHMLLFWGLIILAIFVLIRWLSVTPSAPKSSTSRIAIEALRQRYARGELNHEEFDKVKREIER